MRPNPQFPAVFIEETLNGKLHFLRSALKKNLAIKINQSYKKFGIVLKSQQTTIRGDLFTNVARRAWSTQI